MRSPMFTVAAVLVSLAAGASAAETRIGPKGQVYVDGRGTVPLAVWNQPPHLFAYYKQLGIRCVVSPANESQFLSTPQPDAPSAAAASGVAILAGGPGGGGGPLWGYEGEVVNSRSPEALRAGYERLHRADPNRFVMVNIAIRSILRGQDPNGFRAALRYTDAVISHVWPECQDPNNPNLRHVATLVDLVRRYSQDRPGGEVSIWPDINPHTWKLADRGTRPGRRYPAPTAEELRFQIWLALIHGADGICFFPISFDPFVFSQIPAKNEHEISWNAVLIERLAPVLTAGESGLKIEAAGDRKDGILDVTTREAGGRHYVFLLNGGRQPQTVTLKAPGLGSEWKLNDAVAQRPIPLAGDSFSENLPGLALRIWELAPAATAGQGPPQAQPAGR